MSDVTNLQGGDYAHMLAKARDAAAGGINAISTGEALAAALVLNRPDWLAAMGFTIAEALERIGPDWARLVPAVAKQFARDAEEEAYAAAERARVEKEQALSSALARNADQEVECEATFVAHGDAPGYRDIDLLLDLKLPSTRAAQRVRLRLDPQNGAMVILAIRDVHAFAWDRSSGRPIDAAPDEQRPSWLP